MRSRSTAEPCDADRTTSSVMASVRNIYDDNSLTDCPTQAKSTTEAFDPQDAPPIKISSRHSSRRATRQLGRNEKYLTLFQDCALRTGPKQDYRRSGTVRQDKIRTGRKGRHSGHGQPGGAAPDETNDEKSLSGSPNHRLLQIGAAGRGGGEFPIPGPKNCRVVRRGFRPTKPRMRVEFSVRRSFPCS